jgi:hypothetical protein
LTANIEHSEGHIAGIEDGLADTCRSKACTQNILISGNIVLFEKSAEVAHVAVHMSVSGVSVQNGQKDVLFKVVVQRIFVTFCDGALNAIVVPQVLESVHAVQRHGVICTNLRFRAHDFHGSHVLGVLESDVMLFHCALDALEGMDQVVEDGHLPLPTLVL